MDDKSFLLEINQIIYPELKELNFNDNYDVLKRFTVDLFDTHQAKTILSNEKKCCICDQDETHGGKFSNDSHVIPASLGNKWIFTKNECDRCNQKYGKEYEDNLAKMLLPNRILHGIPKRHGMPKLADEIKNVRFQIEKKENQRILNVITKNNDTSSIFNINEGKIELQIPTQGYYPNKAIMSLVHSFWLSIDQKTRNENLTILSWLKGEFEIFPIHYYYCNIPQINNDKLAFIIYRKKSNLDSLADFICVVRISMNTIILEIPDTKVKKYKPGLLPSISTKYISNIEPTITYHTISGNSFVRATTQKVNLLFDIGQKSVITKDKTVQTYEKQIGSLHYQQGEVQLVSLTIEGGKESAIIDHTYMKKIKKESKEYIEIRGGNLAAQITLYPFDPNNQFNISLDFENNNIDSILKTALFLRMIKNDSKIIIKNLLRKIEDLNITMFTPKEVISDTLMDYINKLYDITVYFKTNINFNWDFNQSDHRDLNIIHSAITEKKAEIGNLTLSVTPFPDKIKLIEEYSNQMVIRFPFVLNFNGKEFDLGIPIIKAKEYKLDDQIEKIQEKKLEKNIQINCIDCIAYFDGEFQVKNAI